MVKSLILTAALAAAVPLDQLLFGRSFDYGSKFGLTSRENHNYEVQAAAGSKEGNGFHSGYFYSFWSQCPSSVTYNNLANGSYNSKWNNCQNWVGG